MLMKFQVINEQEPTIFNALIEGVREHIHEQIGNEAAQPLMLMAELEAKNRGCLIAQLDTL